MIQCLDVEMEKKANGYEGTEILGDERRLVYNLSILSILSMRFSYKLGTYPGFWDICHFFLIFFKPCLMSIYNLSVMTDPPE